MNEFIFKLCRVSRLVILERTEDVVKILKENLKNRDKFRFKLIFIKAGHTYFTNQTC